MAWLSVHAGSKDADQAQRLGVLRTLRPAISYADDDFGIAKLGIQRSIASFQMDHVRSDS